MAHAPLERMHRDPKREAQIVEDEDLTAQPQEAVSVANPDPEQGVEAAAALEEKRKREAATVTPTKLDPSKASPPPKLSPQDKLDRERADGEGMGPPLDPN